MQWKGEKEREQCVASRPRRAMRARREGEGEEEEERILDGKPPSFAWTAPFDLAPQLTVAISSGLQGTSISNSLFRAGTTKVRLSEFGCSYAGKSKCCKTTQSSRRERRLQTTQSSRRVNEGAIAIAAGGERSGLGGQL
eukprot:243662-Rhodomonas_salina.2